MIQLVSMVKLLLAVIFLISLSGCPDKSSEPLPDLKKYEADGALMVNICKKFSDETDAQKLHSAATAVQAARVIACFNYNEECPIYGRCLAVAIKASEDKDISLADRTEMKHVLAELKTAIETGKVKLQAEWEKNKPH